MTHIRAVHRVARHATKLSVLLSALILVGLVSVPIASADQLTQLQDEYKKSGGDGASAKKLGRAFLEANKLPEATKVFEDLADKLPADAEAHYLYGEALMGAGKFKEAAIELKRAANLEPNKPTYTLRAGEALLNSGRFDELTELTTAAASKMTDAGSKETLDWLAKMARERKTEIVTPRKRTNNS